MKPILLFLLFFLFSSEPVFAGDVVINEFNPASDPEWVELYNTTNIDVSLDGCTLYLDNDQNIQKISFTSSDIILQSQKFKVIEKGTFGWNNFWLNNSGDTVKLSCSWGEDSVAYGSEANAVVGIPSSTEVIARSTDGTGGWVITSPTKGSTNNTSTPAPTATSTPTLSPTNTPTPMKTPTPTKTPTKAPTSAPTATPTPTPKTSAQTLPSATGPAEVLSASESPEINLVSSSETATPTQAPIAVAGVQSNIPRLAFIGAGLFLLASGIILAWKHISAKVPQQPNE